MGLCSSRSGAHRAVCWQPRAMREDFLVETRAPGDDPRSVRRREALEHRARDADKKRAQRRPRKR
jgi:hypothetical protein